MNPRINWNAVTAVAVIAGVILTLVIWLDAKLDARFDRIDTRIAKVETAIETGLADVGRRLDDIERHLRMQPPAGSQTAKPPIKPWHGTPPNK